MIKSALLSSIPNIVHGFGTASELVPQALQSVWERRPQKKQVHGTRIAQVTEAHQHIGEADGFHTRLAGIPVSVITADCVPLLLAKRDGSHVAAVHAGWRGLAGGIIPHALEVLDAGGDWVAAIGPTICAACYEVSEELAQRFAQSFPAIARERLLPTHRHLELRAVAEYQLLQGGVTALEHVGGCACCARDEHGALVYRSYRRGDRNSQQHAGLYIVPPT
ncbi:YfiH family protein [Pseudoduganella lurida]|uniref:YfiH family protein n=1 Tax=Pseudoduganella lurida TaxID=1036180 RepID=A0A562RKS5_9BURK|nr:polyphenol oxidase family protein [Pseudoduganella lurida]TWI69639.1 YfiH family protein [Pseudoduganella lurida]